MTGRGKRAVVLRNMLEFLSHLMYRSLLGERIPACDVRIVARRAQVHQRRSLLAVSRGKVKQPIAVVPVAAVRRLPLPVVAICRTPAYTYDRARRKTGDERSTRGEEAKDKTEKR